MKSQIIPNINKPKIASKKYHSNTLKVKSFVWTNPIKNINIKNINCIRKQKIYLGYKFTNDLSNKLLKSDKGIELVRSWN